MSMENTPRGKITVKVVMGSKVEMIDLNDDRSPKTAARLAGLTAEKGFTFKVKGKEVNEKDFELVDGDSLMVSAPIEGN